MSGSAKGRVIFSRAVRNATAQPIQHGTCAWCGWECATPKVAGLTCLRCGSDEIDWTDPLRVVARPYVPQNTHVPGLIAASVLGARVHGRR
jgi:hypothetical protein